MQGTYIGISIKYESDQAENLSSSNQNLIRTMRKVNMEVSQGLYKYSSDVWDLCIHKKEFPHISLMCVGVSLENKLEKKEENPTIEHTFGRWHIVTCHWKKYGTILQGMVIPL